MPLPDPVRSWRRTGSREGSVKRAFASAASLIARMRAIASLVFPIQDGPRGRKRRTQPPRCGPPNASVVSALKAFTKYASLWGRSRRGSGPCAPAVLDHRHTSPQSACRRGWIAADGPAAEQFMLDRGHADAPGHDRDPSEHRSRSVNFQHFEQPETSIDARIARVTVACDGWS